MQGLTGLVQSCCRPTTVCLRPGEGAGGSRSVLLVDANAVEYTLLHRLGGGSFAGIDWRDPATFHQQLYEDTCR